MWASVYARGNPEVKIKIRAWARVGIQELAVKDIEKEEKLEKPERENRELRKGN